MPILGVVASSISGNLYSASYESIATFTGAQGVFTSIPQTYKNLQIRWLARDTSGSASYVYFQMNGVGGTSYSYHSLTGNGASVSSNAQVSQGAIVLAQPIPFSSTTANVYAEGVVDILDYTNTTTNKTVKSLSGFDANGSGTVGLFSGAFLNTSAISSITVGVAVTSPAAFCSFALYGVK